MKPQRPVATILNAEEVILDALLDCFEQWDEIKRLYRAAPDTAPLNEELPAIYFKVGGAIDPFGDGGEGSEILNRNFITRLLLSPWEAAVDSDELGNADVIAGTPWIGKMRNWVANHPRLDLTNEDDLTYDGLPNMPWHMTVRDNSLQLFPAPGGGNKRYLGIEFELNIPVRVYFRTDQY